MLGVLVVAAVERVIGGIEVDALALVVLELAALLNELPIARALLVRGISCDDDVLEEPELYA